MKTNAKKLLADDNFEAANDWLDACEWMNKNFLKFHPLNTDRIWLDLNLR